MQVADVSPTWSTPSRYQAYESTVVLAGHALVVSQQRNVTGKIDCKVGLNVCLSVCLPFCIQHDIGSRHAEGRAFGVVGTATVGGTIPTGKREAGFHKIARVGLDRHLGTGLVRTGVRGNTSSGCSVCIIGDTVCRNCLLFCIQHDI